ncbi:uncharacterized protein [Procambarus clarkii]|uniref:uncharacterized protein n=1 Tax=Procambarus clarkii TaxID=6728 RepID=UPI00374382DC
MSRKLLPMLEEEKSSFISLATNCLEELFQLGKYWEQRGDLTDHEQFQDQFYGLVLQNQGAMKLLEQEDISVVVMTTPGEEEKTRLQTPQMLRRLNRPLEAVTITHRPDQHNVAEEDWLRECEELSTVHISMKSSLEMFTPAWVSIHCGFVKEGRGSYFR